MAETTARELKLVQYLNEAYGKEKQLETVLQAQIKLTKAADRKTITKRLEEHYKETKAQSRGLEKRIKALGGKADSSSIPGPDLAGNAVSAVANVANKAMAAAKGPVQAMRGTSPADNLLRNMRDAFWNEAEEIAHYNVIEAVADQLGDKETVKLAKEFRRQEERMQNFIEKQLPQLVKDVIKTEVPKEDREPEKPARSRSRSSSSSSSSRSRSASSRSGSGSGSGRKSAAKASSSSSKSASSSSRSRSASSGSSATGTKRSAGTKRAASTKRASGTSGSSGSSGSSNSSGGSSSGSGSGSGSGSSSSS